MKPIAKYNAWAVICLISGEQYKFSIALESKYGEGTSEELELLARTIMKVSRIDYEDKIRYYKLIVEKLKKEKGIE